MNNLTRSSKVNVAPDQIIILGLPYNDTDSSLLKFSTSIIKHQFARDIFRSGARKPRETLAIPSFPRPAAATGKVPPSLPFFLTSKCLSKHPGDGASTQGEADKASRKDEVWSVEESENLGLRKTWATWSAATNLGVPSDLEQKWANHQKGSGVWCGRRITTVIAWI